VVEFKPSDVRIDAIPFVNTFRRAEAEAAAAVLVRACVVHGDEWAYRTGPELAAVLKADVEAKLEPFAALARNPFFRPSLHALVSGGFAEWVDGLDPEPIRFTAVGLEQLRRFVRKAESEVSNG
jgi:hypothetical protein